MVKVIRLKQGITFCIISGGAYTVGLRHGAVAFLPGKYKNTKCMNNAVNESEGI